MKERILEEIKHLSLLVAHYNECKKADDQKFREKLIKIRKDQHPDYDEDLAMLYSFAELDEYYEYSDEHIRIKQEVKEYLYSVIKDIKILETLKDIGKDFIYWHDYTMDYYDTFIWYYKQNKRYKHQQTVEYFNLCISFSFIGYLFYGYAAAFEFLDQFEIDTEEDTVDVTYRNNQIN